jgi:hypothetical protein
MLEIVKDVSVCRFVLDGKPHLISRLEIECRFHIVRSELFIVANNVFVYEKCIWETVNAKDAITESKTETRRNIRSSFLRIVTQLLVLMKDTGLHCFPNLLCTRKKLREKMLAIKGVFLFILQWLGIHEKAENLGSFVLVASSSPSRTCYLWVSEIPIQHSISHSLKCAVWDLILIHYGCSGAFSFFYEAIYC